MSLRAPYPSSVICTGANTNNVISMTMAIEVGVLETQGPALGQWLTPSDRLLADRYSANSLQYPASPSFTNPSILGAATHDVSRILLGMAPTCDTKCESALNQRIRAVLVHRQKYTDKLSPAYS